MKKQFFSGLLCVCAFVAAAVPPDFRPKFDKTPYKGTFWTQVNPWWLPSKQSENDSGGPNYARHEYPRDSQWGKAQQVSYPYGNLNWQVELNVPHIGYANTFKRMLTEQKEMNTGTKFSIFLTYSTSDYDKALELTVKMLGGLRDELKNHPAVFRIHGAPVISVYTPNRFTPEQWGRLIPAVEKKCGKFIWLFNTCRNTKDDADAKNGPVWVRSLLPYFDGVSQYGNYSVTSQQAHYKWLSEVMKEYPHKIMELSCQNAYASHFCFGGVATKLSKKWRASFDDALSHCPDSIVLTNFFDHYENSLVLPCYEREDFMLRYAQKRITDWRGGKFTGEKTPELVLTNYTGIMLGNRPLDFEVIGFPIDSPHKKVILMLDLCDSSGKVLHKFPAKQIDLSDLSVTEYTIPSEKFAGERGVVPRLRYLWLNREFKMNYNPMTLISPSMTINMMFWARSTKNSLQCRIVNPNWELGNTKAGGTFLWRNDGLTTLKTEVASLYGYNPRQLRFKWRLMRNGLEYYSHQETGVHMNFFRIITLPSPGGALNWYYLEAVNSNGYRYQTLPIWVTNNRRKGFVSVPILCADDRIKDFRIEAAAVPYFYYPCAENTGSIILDYSGYMHNGRSLVNNGGGFGGGHLGYMGYYHYHNGAVAPHGKQVIFDRDEKGKGMLRFTGKECAMFQGGTAFVGASTYELSVQPQQIGERAGLIGTANNQINLSIEEDGRVCLERGTEIESEGGWRNPRRYSHKVFSKEKLEAGRWYRIAAVYDLKKIFLYINGELQGEAEIPPSRGHGAINHLTVGSLCGWLWSPKNHFKGNIREIRFYGRNLKPEEFLKQNKS